jgi:hypothetical protein
VTDAERVDAVAKLGFTPRQAGFLVTVALHAGVCLSRQYATYSGRVWGRVVRDFFAMLVKRRFATACPCAREGANLYHLQNKTIYRAIGEPDSRLRRPIALARAVERLMVLDAVLADPDVVWLGAERDKVAHFRGCTSLPEEDMPRLIFRSPNGAETMRYFPDRLPIGCHPDGRAPVFLYLVRAWDPFEFRLFLQRHGALLRALAEWRIRLLVPPHLEGAEKPHEVACWNEFATPLKPDQVDELRWYFERRRALGDASPDSDEERFRRAHLMFSKPRYRALYKQWSELGDGLLELQGSHLLGEALEGRSGRVDCHVLERQYSHLSPLVGSV